MFNLSGKCQAVFHRDWTNSHLRFLCERVPVAPHPRQHLINMKSLFNFSHSGGCVVYFILVLICIFLVTNEVEHHLMYLLVIWLSCYFLKSSLYILDIRPLMVICVKIIFYSVTYLWTLDEVFCWIEIFAFHVAQFVNNFLYG